MRIFSRRVFPKIAARGNDGFTLVELLVAMALIGVMAGWGIPAFTSMLQSKGVESAAYAVKDMLETARGYAIANNTYTWVGFYEEAMTASSSVSTPPPYPGKGRILMAIVASKDGTEIFKSSDSAATLPASRICPVGRVVRLENIHLADVDAPAGPPADPGSLAGRPGFPYDESDPRNGSHGSHYARISSESGDKTKFPFLVQALTFYKTVRFNPRGEANVNSTYELRPAVEIGLKPTNGTAVSKTANVAALQFSGIVGGVTLYRR